MKECIYPPLWVQTTHLHRRCHNLVADGEVFRWEVVVLEIEGRHVGEDAQHGVIAEGIDAKNVEVPQEARRHGVPPTARGTHG